MRSLRPRALVLAAALGLGAPAARAADVPYVPLVLSHHGRLLGANDQPVEGDVQITFGIYDNDNPNKTTAAWSDQRTVHVSNGMYNVVLGSDEKPLGTQLLAKAELYFSVTINGNELLPRQRLTSAPFALRAGRAAQSEHVLAGGVDTAALQDGAITLAKLQLTGGKMVGLDSDTLDGFDSSAFAPAAIEGSVDDTLTRVKGLETTLAGVKGTVEAGATTTDLSALAAVVGTINTTTGTINTTTGAINTTVGAINTTTGTINTAVGTINTTVNANKSSLTALDTKVTTLTTNVATVDTKVSGVNTTVGTINTGVGNLATSVAALQTTLDTLTKRSNFSPTCSESNTGYANRVDCLADGRWHTLSNQPPTDYDRNGAVTGAETCRWIIDSLVAAGLRARAGVWQVSFSYDADPLIYTGFYRIQDDHNLSLFTPTGATAESTDNSSVVNCNLPAPGSSLWNASIFVKL